MTAIVFGMAACDSGDYSSKNSSDSTAAANATVSSATTTTADSSAATAAKPAASDATAATHKKKARASMPEARKRLFAVAEHLTDGFRADERALFVQMLKRAVANLERPRGVSSRATTS